MQYVLLNLKYKMSIFVKSNLNLISIKSNLNCVNYHSKICAQYDFSKNIFVSDHVTLKTAIMMLKITLINYILIYIQILKLLF